MKSYLEKLFAPKNLADSSLKKYTAKLTKLNNGDPVKNLNFLKNYEEITKQLSEMNDRMKRDTLIAIVSALTSLPKLTKPFKIVRDKYGVLLKEYNNELSSSNVKSDNMKDSWLTTEQINQKYKQLLKQTKKINVSDFTKHEYDLMYNLVILSLYKFLPPRREQSYISMQISNIDIPDNQLDLKNKQFIFRKYKTAKVYGDQVVKIPKELMIIIDKYLLIHPKFHLINSGSKVPFLIASNNSYGKPHMILNSLSKTFGKSVGSATMRRIFATEKYADVVDQMEKDAADMGTSVGTIKSHYIKND
jgi:hypothetical protein